MRRRGVENYAKNTAMEELIRSSALVTILHHGKKPEKKSDKETHDKEAEHAENLPNFEYGTFFTTMVALM